MDWVARLKALQAKVSERAAELDRELAVLNGVWDAAPAPGVTERAAALPLGRLEDIYRVLSYAARWTEQIQERVVQLASA